MCCIPLKWSTVASETKSSIPWVEHLATESMSSIPWSGAPGRRAQLNVQSGHCKLKPNALVSEQCSLWSVDLKIICWEIERLSAFTQRSLGERSSAERDPAWSCTLERGGLEGSKRLETVVLVKIYLYKGRIRPVLTAWCEENPWAIKLILVKTGVKGPIGCYLVCVRDIWQRFRCCVNRPSVNVISAELRVSNSANARGATIE